MISESSQLERWRWRRNSQWISIISSSCSILYLPYEEENPNLCIQLFMSTVGCLHLLQFDSISLFSRFSHKMSRSTKRKQTREKAHNRFFGNLDTKFSRFLQHKRRKKWTNNRFFLLLLLFSLLFFTDENSLVKFALQHSSTIGRSVVGGCRAIFSLFPLKY